MNPHFIFNTLNSIQEYIYSNEKKLATSYLVKFSRLIRIYLDHSLVSEVTLAKEIAALELYLYLEKDRFSDELDYTILVDDTVSTEEIKVPSLLLQPYVENALKHGLLHKKGRGGLVITFKLNDEKNVLTYVIIDDGVGREKSKVIQQNRIIKHKSFATQDRLQLLNYNKDKKIKILIEDLVKTDDVEDSGTKVTIQIPI